MNVLAITQARTGSTRLPGKIMKIVNGLTLLEIHLLRLLKSKMIEQLVVATTTESQDDTIIELAKTMNVSVFRGSTDNVLERFYYAALSYKPEWVVRITSDCPLIDPDLVDEVISKAIETNNDYYSNTLSPSYPNGMDVEVFKFSALEQAFLEATLNSDKEHVTPYIYRNSTFNNQNLFKADNLSNPENLENVRLTVDEAADFEVIKNIIEQLGIEKDWKSYSDYYQANKKINSLNVHINRNEGFYKSLEND
jgi:spore coat polysaccharide biosynthesis protein SpsF